MTLARKGGVAAALTLGVVLAACGATSSSLGGHEVAAAPTDASQGDFCRTFTELGDVTLHEAADRLTAVGTPSGIGGAAREGFVVLVTHLFVLPDDVSDVDFVGLAQDLSGNEQAAVTAFVTYAHSECQILPSM